MSIFQNSVLKEYSKNIDKDLVSKRWKAFQNWQKDIEAIKTYKEEIYQEGFLRDIFENCLGYTLNTTNKNEYNLEREKKNETDSKKADGVIYVNNKVVGVIELKGQDTKNLDRGKNKESSPIEQAFGYLTSHDSTYCKYVIVSNFDELRFYIKDRLNYEKFNLFNLNEEEFYKLHLLLSYESIKENIPSNLKEKSTTKEIDISKDLYKKFSNFRTSLFENLVKNNINHDKAILLRFTQKICDRIIFILFAEDRGLLRTNTIEEIKKRHEEDLFDVTLYGYYKIYFEAINKGSLKLDIPQYNGGLFAIDEELDNLIIDDEILNSHVPILSKFDFASEISVNILGHIFEQSLTDLEELQANIENINFDKTKTKRKKDGVFYTPEYITHYIVDNTLGKLCNEKKEELNLLDVSNPINPKKLTKQEKQTLENIYSYRDYLLNLKILDPACGSGAFLNQALEFLIKEHDDLDKLRKDFEGEGLGLYDIEASILEHNLCGVDINEDAIEIAKLSLWLRSARRGRPLTKLANKIICANSLLEMPFEENSFDVIIGNPPYVKEDTNKNAFKGLKESPYYQGKMDLWYFFGCQALDMIKENGLIGFIAPNNWISNSGASKFRNKVLEDGKILEFIDFGDFKVFEDAGIQTMIYIMTKSKDNLQYKLKVSKNLNKNINNYEVLAFLNKNPNEKFNFFMSNINKNKMLNQIIGFSNQNIENFLEKIESFKNFNIDGKDEIFSGIDFPQDFLNKKSKEILGEQFNVGDGVFVISNKEKKLLNLSDNELSLLRPFYTTNELGRYWGNKENKFWVIYTNSSFKNQNSLDNYPNLKNHLDKFQEIITSENKPYGLNRSSKEKNFLEEKIIVKRKSPNSPTFTYVDFDCFFNRTFMIIKSNRMNLKYLTSLLNSKLIAFWLKYKGKMQGDIFQVDKEPLLNLPILKIDEESQKPFISLVDEILEAKQKINDYKNILDEAIKNNNFDREIALKKELENLENIYTTNEKTIDQMVYKLYDLNEDEIKIVKGI